MDSIHQIVRDAEDAYTEGHTQQGKYINWNMYETIETIDAYLNSKHTSGSTDSLGREKPFFNIVTAAANIWYRATDLDRKDIRIKPDSRDNVGLAFIATVILQQWMDENRFGVFLNSWGRQLARYGSSVVKFVENGDKLIPSVVPWSRFIADPVDFNAIPKIEKFYKTPSQLRNMATKGHPDYAGYDMEVVKELVDSLTTRKTQEGFNKDSEDHFVELYEVHGELPEWFLGGERPDNDEDVTYRQQMHVVSYVNTGVSSGNGDVFNDFTLYKGKEKKDPYMLTHLIEEDGRTLAIGAVEYLFDAQWMQNHSVKQWKDQLDLASKIVFQTADANFIGRNVLSDIEGGDILIYKDTPLSQINNQGHDQESLKGFLDYWKVLSQEITSTPDAVRGNTLPSGTPYSLGAYTGSQALSLFELMVENKGLALEDMMKIHIIPHLRRKLKNKDEIVAIFDSAGITQIDSLYLPKEAIRRYNKESIKRMLELKPEDMMTGNIPQPFDKQTAEQGVQEELNPLGNTRFFKPDEAGQATWDFILSKVNWDRVKVEVTNENTDKQTVLTTLSSLFQTLAQSNPQKANQVLDRILTETGVMSPIELSNSAQPATAPPTGGTGEALNELAVNQ